MEHAVSKPSGTAGVKDWESSPGEHEIMNDADRKKSGAVKVEDYEREDYLETLSEVSKKLQEQYKTSKFDNKAVGNLVALIKQFLEDALGVKALPPRPLPKIPAKLFQDTKPKGALYHILSKFHELMASRSLKRADFTNPYHRKQLLGIAELVLKDLEDKKILLWPKIFIHPSCDGEIPLLKDMITSLKGTIAPKVDSPGVTHQIQPFGPKGDPDDGVQYMRNLGKRGSKSLVHWWYYPDSYDEIIEADDAPEIIEVDKLPEGPWKIYTRWVKDSVKYNEWMNPIDYELEDQPAAKDSTAGSTQEQTATSAALPVGVAPRGMATANFVRPSASLPLLGQTATKLAPPAGIAAMRLPEVAPGEGVEVLPGLVKQKLLQPDPKFLDKAMPAINLLQVQESVKAKKTGSKGEGNTAKKPIKLPACSDWFKLEAVHEIEREAFARVFVTTDANDEDNGVVDSAAEEEYMALRNAIILKFRANPSRHLSFLEASKTLSANVSLLAEIWAFMESWGVINFNAPDIAEADTGRRADDDAGQANDRETAAAALKETQAVYLSKSSTKPQQGVAAAGGKVKSAGLVGRRAKRRKTVHPPEPYIKEARHFCNAMPAVECTKLRYHCTKLPDLDLCPQAYAEGRFPAGCTAKDFIRIDQNAAEGVDDSVWSDMDTLLLLEGLELFGDNWAEISDHVGTKSQVQCITHFLKLPIEDDFLDQMEDPDRAVNGGGDKSAGVAGKAGQQQIPFLDQANPVTAQVAFLATMVGPEVAAAAAQKALEVLLEEDDPPAQQPTEATDKPEEAADNPTVDKPHPDNPPSVACVRDAAEAGLSAAAIKARQMAEEEEAQIRTLLKQAIAAQIELVELRLKVLPQMKQAMQDELSSLQAQREAVTADRVKLQDLRASPQVSNTLGMTVWQPVVPTSHIMPTSQGPQNTTTAGTSSAPQGAPVPLSTSPAS